MTERQVAITGIGIISPIGHNQADYWEGLTTARSGMGPITLFDPVDHTTKFAAEVKDFDPEKWIDRREARRLDRFSQFALAATSDAVDDSGLELDKEELERIGVVIGTGIGGLSEIEAQHDVLRDRNAGRVSPFLVPKLMGNAASGQVGIKYGLKGPNLTCISACASATHSLIEAMHIIQRGEADIMVSGGTEAAITPLGVAGFCSLKALSTRNDDPQSASRPFDKDRDGFVIGEGAGVVIMEELEHAKVRGAQIYAIVAGGGQTCDGFHITQPSPDGDGACRSMKAAMATAGLNPEDITYINAHGTSTHFNDLMESKAIRSVFGAHADKLCVSSTKSMIGHLLGGSGGAEIVACALMMKNGVVHPTANHDAPGEDCDLDYVPKQARDLEIKALLSNSFGFGGHNATICLKKLD